MPKRSANDYIYDEFVVDDDEDGSGAATAPHDAKRTKTNGSTAVAAAGAPRPSRSTTAQKDDNGDDFWELTAGGARRVTLSEYRGKTLVNVREYYEANGKKLPGKKGISMPVEQFSALIAALPQIEEALKQKGESIPRPAYGGGDGDGGSVVAKEAAMRDADADGAKEEKQNHEATSDEDED